MERNISKLHLFYSSMTTEALIPLMRDIETVFITVVQSARLFMSCGLTEAAKKEVMTGIEIVYESIINLIEHCKECYVAKVRSLSPSMTGAVWDACKKLNGLSDSNKKACMKEVLRSVSVTRDIRKECEEFLENGDEDDWDGLLDDDDEGLEGEEVVESGRSEQVQMELQNSIASLQHLLEAVFKLYSTSFPEDLSSEMVDQVNRVSEIISQLCKDADNLGMMIYGSEKNDVEVVKQTGTDLANLLKALEEVV
ncbi:hypothetical protein JH06_3834 [Blastocystis sp. subtype 4]|uniref:hypothetical protein n=1 Tax=Blastocystis sp. subtype 4 TaxID=944170 RepID=UPI00071134EE|nr:hypothetical protein JH06_3834 [Blastocystis sp. subtype 4]KNB42551.1 hypothetical protein JH06_3834 [Blastocystis sp. subtype 4]|eukprot:XP_014525994.1 hypothetical protein JH06_3834 [Blastocystis sp. subtype 4]